MRTAMNRAIFIVLTFLMMYALTGCGKEDAKSVLLEDSGETTKVSAEENEKGDGKSQTQEAPSETPTATPTPVIQVTVNCDCGCKDGTCQVTAEGAAVIPNTDGTASESGTGNQVQNAAGTQPENSAGNQGQNAAGATSQANAAQPVTSGLTAEGKVNINTADETTLQTLNGIGEVRAQAIIAYRQSNGAFQSIEEIKNIDGIADGIFNKIKEDISVG